VIPLLETGMGSVERLLGARFMIAVLLPLLVAGCASALVGVAAAGHTPDDAVKAWQRYSASGQILLGFGAAVGVIAAAYVLASFQTSLLRFLEGYWPAWLGGLRRRRIDRYQRAARVGWSRVEALHGDGRHTEGAALAAKLAVDYPPPGRLADGCQPTRAGNRLRAAEYYPLERYGIDAVVIWIRLLPLLPAEAAKRIASARTALDAAACLFALAVGFGLVWPIALVAAGASGSLAVWCLLAWPVAAAALAAVAKAAVPYGQEIRVAFDLYRSLLLQHLGWQIPADPFEERRMWTDLAHFYQRNLPMPAN
jgi:hypothetical protein